MDMQIPGFDIERELGQGAMASVYLATQRSLQRKVALKIMAASLAADPTFCERFLREGRTLARLAPNAWRTATSFRRRCDRASNMLATLAHAISSTNAAAPNKSRVIRLVATRAPGQMAA